MQQAFGDDHGRSADPRLDQPALLDIDIERDIGRTAQFIPLPDQQLMGAIRRPLEGDRRAGETGSR